MLQQVLGARVWLRSSGVGVLKPQQHPGDGSDRNVMRYKAVVFFPGWLKCVPEDEGAPISWFPSDQVIEVEQES